MKTFPDRIQDVLRFDFDTLITIDFETYYDDIYTLKKLTTEAYIRDERFEAIGVGVKVNDGETVWCEAEDFARWAKGIDWSRVAVLHHHSNFDGLILAHHFGVHPGFFLDTLSMARALHGTEVGNSLEKLAVYYGAGEKGHEVINAKGKRRGDFTPEEFLRYGAYCRNDADLTRKIFDSMLQNGFPESELHVIDATVKMFTRPKFVLDEPLLRGFLADEGKRKAELLEKVAKEKSTLMSNDKFAALLQSMDVEPPRKISPRTGLETWAFAKTDPGMAALLEDERDEVRWLAEARVGVKSTINETRTERLLKAGAGGKPVCVYLRYAGAHTFRWSGSDKLNFQNFPRGGTLRKSLLAPEGQVLVVADSAQIEARVTAWLAGQEDMTDAFAQGRDIYSEFASEIYGREINPKERPEDKTARFVAKAATLGLGFQMGPTKFAETMLKGAVGGPPVQFTDEDADTLGVNISAFINDSAKVERVQNMTTRLPFEELLIHCAVAEKVVYKYRNANKRIVALWKLMESVIEAMDEGGEYTFGGPTECCATLRHGILLPSGLVMRYPGLRSSEEGGYSYMGGHAAKERRKIYGGALTENVVQALARQVVAEQMMRVQTTYGYEIITCTHDEVVLAVDEKEAPQALERVLEVMRTAPIWAEGLPLNAEGGSAKSYGNIK